MSLNLKNSVDPRRAIREMPQIKEEEPISEEDSNKQKKINQKPSLKVQLKFKRAQSKLYLAIASKSHSRSIAKSGPDYNQISSINNREIHKSDIYLRGSPTPQHELKSVKDGNQLDQANNLKKQQFDLEQLEALILENKVSYIDKVKNAINAYFKKTCCNLGHFNFLKSIRLSLQPEKQQEQEISEADELNTIVSSLTVHEKMEKAARHFYDGYLLRTARNDLDGKKNQLKKTIWLIINNSIWNHFLWSVCLLYQLQVFWEPLNKHSPSLQQKQFQSLVIIEVLCIFWIMLDTILNAILTLMTVELKHLSFQSKVAFKVIFMILLLSDFINHVVTYPSPSFRFSRVIRSFLLINFSKNLRRQIVGILKSLQNLLILFIVYLLVIFMWAFIGINLFGDGSDIQYDLLANDYSNFLNLSYMLYLLSFMDYFPDIMLPQMSTSRYYFFYYFPFILLFFFMFIPIPQALLYENFQLHRSNIQQRDSFKQKQAIAICFFCLDDEQNGEVEFSKAQQFFKMIYSGSNKDQDVIDLMRLMDVDESESISLDEFFHVFLIINQYPKFSFTRLNSPKCWDRLREMINSKFHLQKHIESIEFSMLMLFLTLLNCALIIAALFIDKAVVLDAFEVIDKVFFSIYVFEVILKILVRGVYGYFEDIWNKFDFCIVFFQFFFDFILFNTISNRVSSSIKANRVLRLAKIQKIFRLFRAFRSLKIVSIILDGFQIFEDVKSLFFKIILCIPVVLQYLILIWVLFFTFSTISVEIILYQQEDYNDYSRTPCDPSSQDQSKLILWSGCEYSDFSTMENAFMMLLQIFISSLSDIINDYSHRMENYWKIATFLGIFKFLAIFLCALFNGLIWEVFNQCNTINLYLYQYLRKKSKFKYRTKQTSGKQNWYQMFQYFFLKEKQEKIQMNNHIQNKLGPQSQARSNFSQSSSDDSDEQIKKIDSKSTLKKMQKKQQQEEEEINDNNDEMSIDHELQIGTEGQKNTTRISSKHFSSKSKGVIINCDESDIEFSDQDDYDSIQRFEEDYYLGTKNSNFLESQKNQIFSFISNQKETSVQTETLEKYFNKDIQDRRSQICTESMIQRKLIPLKSKYLISHYPQFFNRDNEEFNVMFKESFQYFQQCGKNENNDNKEQMRRFLKASLGYQQHENQEQQLSIMEQQKNLLYHFNNLLKQRLKCRSLVEVLINFDHILTQQFLPKNSFTSFIFENYNKQWFSISKNAGKFRFNKLGVGPWESFEELFMQSHRYKAENNIYFYDMNSKFPETADTEIQKQIDKLKNVILNAATPTLNNQSQPHMLQDLVNRTDSSAYILFSLFPKKQEKSETQTQLFQNDKQSGVKNFMQIWYLSEFNFRKINKKASYINVLQNKRNTIQLIQLADAIADRNGPIEKNKADDQEQQKIISRHSIAQTIALCKDTWNLVRPRFHQILQQIREFEQRRSELRDDQYY